VAESWQQVSPLETEDRPAPRRLDLVALVAGVAFVVIAVAGMTDITFGLDVLAGGVLLALVLVGAGIALLVSELRRARHPGGPTG
jgi:predicted lysophospholipase L1 biosynthesis ABC-type transport system permease subunit